MKWYMQLSLLVGLAACGPLTQGNPTLDFARGVADQPEGNDQAAGPSLNDLLNREFIGQQPNDIILASVISRAATAVMIKAGTNGSKVTWFSPDGIGITLDNGVLIATRGLGADLMGSDAAGVISGLDGAATHDRTHAYMNGLDQIETRSFTCSVTKDRAEDITIYERTYTTSVFIERCSDGITDFTNTFWRTADGVIWQARQWVSGDVGYLGYQRLVDPAET